MKRNFFEILILTLVAFFSCNKGNYDVENNNQGDFNTLEITEKGDTLETGMWKYTTSQKGISKIGEYNSGFKVGEWFYVQGVDTTKIKWSIYDKDGVKFNIPTNIKSVNKIELPIIYEGDIDDGDKYTYVALLKYNLVELNSSINEYLKEINKHFENETNGNVLSKEFKKYTFKNSAIYKVSMKEKKEHTYEIVSYIFQVKDSMYDLTYKNVVEKTTDINLDIFNDVLYSIK